MGYLYSFIKNKNMEKIIQLPKVIKQVREKEWDATFFHVRREAIEAPQKMFPIVKYPLG